MTNPTIKLTQEEFEALPNYSCSMPTQFKEGKRWRRAKQYHDQDLSDPSKWWVVVDMIVQDQGGIGTRKCVARWHEIHIINETETLIRNRLYVK